VFVHTGVSGLPYTALRLLLIMLLLCWTLAAFGEKLAYRGYLNPIREILHGNLEVVMAVLLSSVPDFTSSRVLSGSP
jgi:hypothetical protein